MTKDFQIGDAPIEAKYHTLMNELAVVLDKILNGNTKPKPNGFCLMVFPFEDFNGRCNYISNAQRDEVLILLKEQVARFEGRLAPEPKGKQ